VGTTSAGRETPSGKASAWAGTKNPAAAKFWHRRKPNLIENQKLHVMNNARSLTSPWEDETEQRKMGPSRRQKSQAITGIRKHKTQAMLPRSGRRTREQGTTDNKMKNKIFH
jgi:hypothetical protein